MNQSNSPWREGDEHIAIGVLSGHYGVRSALPEIGAILGRGVTYDALANRFKRLGLQAPERYCRRGAPVASLDYEDDAPTEQRDTWPVEADRTYVEKPTPSLPEAILDRGELETILVIPDTHAPFHDKRAWGAMISAAKRLRPHTIIHLGDLADVYALSAHDRDPKRATEFKSEVEVTNGLLDELDDLGAQRRFMTLGNHEARWDRYILRKAPELHGMVDLVELLRFRERGWHVTPYMDHLTLGRVHATHEAGHYGVNAVKQTGEAFESSVIFGHTHRLSKNYFGSVTGSRHVAASLGWLGDLDSAKYLPNAKKRYWQHGFGVIRVEPCGNFHLKLVPIIDGRCEIDGSILKAAA